MRGVMQVQNWVEASWNVMVHAQKPHFVFRRNGRVHLNRRGRQVSRLVAAEVCASAVVMLDTPCSVVMWRVLATHSIRQFPLHFPSRASPCAITFQLESTHQYYGPVYKIQSPSLPGAWDLCTLCCCRLPVSAFPALPHGLWRIKWKESVKN